MEEAKIRIDPFKSVDEQLTTTLKAISRLIPISLEKVKMAIHIPGEDTGRVFGILNQYGKTMREEWQPDGSWIAVVEIPGGMQESFYQKLNELTHGKVEIKLLK
jgi:ribosome maturation protein SDO1